MTPTSTPTWTTHAAYAAQDHYAELLWMHQAEGRARAEELKAGEAHVEAGLNGFPCRGTFHFLERTGPHWVAVCDGCGRELAVPRGQIDPAWLVSWRLEHSYLPMAIAEPDDLEPRWQAQARAALNRYAKGKAAPPILVGPAGAGKTYLLAKAGEHLIRTRHLEVRYWTLTDLLDVVRRSFNDPSADDAFYAAQRTPVLILDDLGADRPTEWAADRLQALIDWRYREQLPILGATNLHPDEWAEAFGDRVASRLGRMCATVPVHGETQDPSEV